MIKVKKQFNFAGLQTVLSIVVFFAIIVILTSPAQYSNATLDGAKLFAVNLLPTLLPFFFLTRILMELGAAEKFAKKLERPCRKLFNIGGIGAFIFISGLLCGYPTGAKLTGDYVFEGKIDSGEAHRITALVSTSGPMFVVGTVGAGFMFSAKIGGIIFLAHILGAIANGIAFRGYLFKKSQPVAAREVQLNKNQKKNGGEIVATAVQDALQSVLTVGVYVILFFLFIEMFFNFFSFDGSVLKSVAAGMIEITRGSFEVGKNVGNALTAIVMLSFLISFGGLSVHLQSLAFLNKAKISYKFFFLQKLAHAIFAAFFAAIICLLFL